MSVKLWSSAAWREQAEDWIDRRLAEAGLERTGPVEQPRVRPWATVLRAQATEERALRSAREQGEPIDPYFTNAPFDELTALLEVRSFT